MRPAVERQASPEQEVDSLIADLFRGVPLGEDELEHARAVVRADVVARREVPVPPPGRPWAAWDRGAALMAERDAALATLLRTDAQRAAFARNAAAHRRTLEGLRREVERRRGDGPIVG